MTRGRGILFTAFEPSGDAHAAPVIAALRNLRPDVPTWACGGPNMRDAGAQIIEETTGNAAMLLSAVSKVQEQHRRLRRLRRWLTEHDLGVFVPVDSPAANWSICKLIRRVKPDTRIVHLVAPQLWAWAPWRIHKLRRLTNHVLCLLPFEPAWFNARSVRATFVGHPVFERASNHVYSRGSGSGGPSDSREVGESEGDGADFPPHSGLELALLPGSRKNQIRANWPMMLEVFKRLRRVHKGLRGVVLATDQTAAALIDRLVGEGFPHDCISIRTGQTRQNLTRSDAALVTSGTATLHVAAAGVPMVIIYNIRKWMWHLLGRWIIHTRTFGLPNLIAASQGVDRIVPELVPHFGKVQPVVDALDRLLGDPSARLTQCRALARMAEAFNAPDYAATAAARILESMR